MDDTVFLLEKVCVDCDKLYPQIEKLSYFMLKKDKGSPNYILVFWLSTKIKVVAV